MELFSIIIGIVLFFQRKVIKSSCRRIHRNRLSHSQNTIRYETTVSPSKPEMKFSKLQLVLKFKADLSVYIYIHLVIENYSI